jgi:hypothetical protein
LGPRCSSSEFPPFQAQTDHAPVPHQSRNFRDVHFWAIHPDSFVNSRNSFRGSVLNPASPNTSVVVTAGNFGSSRCTTRTELLLRSCRETESCQPRSLAFPVTPTERPR